MSGVFSAAATDVLALDTTDVFSADTSVKSCSGEGFFGGLGVRGIYMEVPVAH